MPPLEQSQNSHDFELSFAATQPFDFHAWLATWQREYVFFRVDVHERINFMAPSVRDLLGYEPAEMLGRDRGTIARRIDDAHALIDRLLGR